MICEVGRETIFGESFPPCFAIASYQVIGPGGQQLLLCQEHHREFVALAESRGAALIEGPQISMQATGNQISREHLTDEVFIVRDPTMAVPELMRCPKCHDFIIEGSRCTFIGVGFHRHLVHASCVGL